VLDEQVLAEEGVRDFERYRIDSGTPLATDLFVSEG
jgi:hypothetical protein